MFPSSKDGSESASSKTASGVCSVDASGSSWRSAIAAAAAAWASCSCCLFASSNASSVILIGHWAWACGWIASHSESTASSLIEFTGACAAFESWRGTSCITFWVAFWSSGFSTSEKSIVLQLSVLFWS